MSDFKADIERYQGLKKRLKNGVNREVIFGYVKITDVLVFEGDDCADFYNCSFYSIVFIFRSLFEFIDRDEKKQSIADL